MKLLLSNQGLAQVLERRNCLLLDTQKNVPSEPRPGTTLELTEAGKTWLPIIVNQLWAQFARAIHMTGPVYPVAIQNFIKTIFRWPLVGLLALPS